MRPQGDIIKEARHWGKELSAISDQRSAFSGQLTGSAGRWLAARRRANTGAAREPGELIAES
jgi:hypothetical protein